MAQPSFTTRRAVMADAEAVAAIYAPFVQNTAISFELHAPSAPEMAERIACVNDRWAWLVAEEEHGRCIGYAYAAEYRSREAYRWTVETTAYTEPGHHGCGVARTLYEALFDILIDKGFCTALAAITLPNDPSVAFHRRLGFQQVGVMHRAGRKFDAWHDVAWYQRALREQPPRG